MCMYTVLVTFYAQWLSSNPCKGLRIKSDSRTQTFLENPCGKSYVTEYKWCESAYVWILDPQTSPSFLHQPFSSSWYDFHLWIKLVKAFYYLNPLIRDLTLVSRITSWHVIVEFSACINQDCGIISCVFPPLSRVTRELVREVHVGLKRLVSNFSKDKLLSWHVFMCMCMFLWDNIVAWVTLKKLGNSSQIGRLEIWISYI